jgi:hypothetical protein
MIYFARVGTDGPIKIGKADDLPRRIKQHGDRYGAPLHVLGIVDGGEDVERMMHGKFDHLRLNYNSHLGAVELFEPEQELLDFIAKHCRQIEIAADVKAVRFELTPEVYQQLSVVAAQHGKSMASYVRALVEQDLAKHRGARK